MANVLDKIIEDKKESLKLIKKTNSLDTLENTIKSLNSSLNFKDEISDIGKSVIDLEIKALKKLRNSIGKSFKDAVNIISKCKSKVIICGVGKSGIIASKISATLSSVGTPSFTISASDCSHGDLGRITKKDILILISYSGNTSELKNIIRYAKSNKILLDIKNP